MKEKIREIIDDILYRNDTTYYNGCRPGSREVLAANVIIDELSPTNVNIDTIYLAKVIEKNENFNYKVTNTPI